MESEGPSTFFSANKKNYAGRFRTSKGILACYTKGQMKNLYPNRDFHILGEFTSEKQTPRQGILVHKEDRLPLSKYLSNSRLVYAVKGFVGTSSGEDHYVALLKNVLPVRVLAFMLCAVLAVGGLLLLNSPIPLSAGAPPAPELEEGAVEWQGTLPEDTGGVTQGIAIPGYKSITIDAGKKDVKVNFVNPEENPCYFVISLLLSDGTELYQSKMIKPGLGLYDITLNEPLEEGSYSAVLKYDTFSLDSLNPLNGAEVNITLNAE